MPQTTEDEPLISYGKPLKGRYQSDQIGAFTLSLGGQPAMVLAVYANTPLPPPAGCPTCATTTSLRPDLAERTN